MPATDEDRGTCATCGGRGWVVRSDEGAGIARRCSCQQHQAVPKLIDGAGIPPRYQSCRLSNFKIGDPDPRVRDALLRARSLCQSYVEQFLDLDGQFRESGLLFVGPPGVGKTHLAVAVLFELIQRYRIRGRFVDFTSLIHQIQSTFNRDSVETQSGILQPIMTAELLVLDELGAQKPRPWITDVLYLVMNTRYTKRLPTLFTTNYRLQRERSVSLDGGAGSGHFDLLESRIPAMLVSRLFEMAQEVPLDSEDFRKTHKMYQHHCFSDD